MESGPWKPEEIAVVHKSGARSNVCVFLALPSLRDVCFSRAVYVNYVGREFSPSLIR